MNPATDETLSKDLRRALIETGITTRDQLDRAVKSGVLLHAPGLGMVAFREAEAWLRKTATTECVTCPQCKGVGVITREKR